MNGDEMKPLFQYMLNRRIKLNQNQASSSRDLSTQVSQRGQPTASTTANASKDLFDKELQSSTLGMFADLGTDRPDFRTHMASCSSSPRGSTYVDPHEKIPPFLLVCVETCAKTGPDPWFNRQVRCGEHVASGRRPDDTDHLSRTRQSCRRHKARGSDRYLESNHEPQCGSIPIKTHIEEHFKKRENTC